MNWWMLQCFCCWNVVWLCCWYLEVAYGLLQWAVVVQHHAPELEWLDMVLVQHEGFLEALHRWLKVTQLSWKRKKRHQHSNSGHVVSQEEANCKVWLTILLIQILCLSVGYKNVWNKQWIPVGLTEALIGIYEVRLQLQCLFKCLNGFLTRENTISFSPKHITDIDLRIQQVYLKTKQKTHGSVKEKVSGSPKSVE